MAKKYSLSFSPSAAPIESYVTKFGGQPTWVTEPQWPISRTTGKPMRFICQVALDPALFGELSGKLAYLFITDDDTFMGNTHDPDGGENAVIVQPGRYDGTTLAQATGPTLQTWVADGSAKMSPAEIEYAVEAQPGDDPDSLDADDGDDASDTDDSDDHWTAAKLGGTPAFVQGPEYPSGGPWRLLLQLNSARVPFWLNFGDAGVGYAFLSADGTHGKFLWQSL